VLNEDGANPPMVLRLSARDNVTSGALKNKTPSSLLSCHVAMSITASIVHIKNIRIPLRPHPPTVRSGSEKWHRWRTIDCPAKVRRPAYIDNGMKMPRITGRTFLSEILNKYSEFHLASPPIFCKTCV
jgi:hypothetical protein